MPIPAAHESDHQPDWLLEMAFEEDEANDYLPGDEERAQCQDRWRHAYFNAIRLGLIHPYQWHPYQLFEGGQP